MKKLLKKFKSKIKYNYPRMIIQFAKYSFYAILYPFFQLFIKQEDNTVLFLSDSRENFSGNFLYVKEEIEKRKKYNIIGVFKKNLKAKRPFKEKFRLLRSLAKAKIIFVDDFCPLVYPIKFKKGKQLVQLWHALGAFKTVGYARMGKPGGPNGYNLTHRNYTGTIVSSESIRKDYAKAYGITVDKVKALGIPRTDIFFDKKYSDNIKKEIYKKYPMLKDKKVILFAPTFRGKGQAQAYYDFDTLDFDRIKKEFSKDYVFIVKLHPFIKNKPNYNFENDDFYIDLSKEREINDLLFITDILITDYSSVIFEYSLFKKPVIFYTPDFEEYIANRDFYYKFDKYNYGIQANNMDELIKALHSNSNNVNTKKIEEFYDYFCSACDGNSTKRVVDYFLEEKK